MSSAAGIAQIADTDDGLASVARLAAGALDGTVVVALPALDLTVCAPDADDRRVAAVRRHVADRSAPTPLDLAAEAPVRRDGEALGAVVLLGGRRRATAGTDHVLRLAALAVLTAVAPEDGTARAPSTAAAAFFADLRRDPPPSARADRGPRRGAGLRPALRRRRAVRRARRAGRRSARSRRSCRTRRARSPTPATAASRRCSPERARRPPDRARPSWPGARRGACAARRGRACRRRVRPGELPRALREARLVLELAARGEARARRAADRHVAAPDPARGDGAGRGRAHARLDARPAAGPRDALGRARCSRRSPPTSAPAPACARPQRPGFAHRHTVAYRLERILELTGHDPRRSEGLEQLNLGLKARAVRDALRPRRPRALRSSTLPRVTGRPAYAADALGIGVATGVYGISFGVLAVGAGLSEAQACAMSLLVFTGGSQFAAVGVIGVRRLAGDGGRQRAAARRPQRRLRPLARAAAARQLAAAGRRGAARDRRDDRDGARAGGRARRARRVLADRRERVRVLEPRHARRRAGRRRPRRSGALRARRDVPRRVPRAARAAAPPARSARGGAGGGAHRRRAAPAHAGRGARAGRIARRARRAAGAGGRG